MKKGLKSLLLLAGIAAACLGGKISKSQAVHAFGNCSSTNCITSYITGGYWSAVLCSTCDYIDNVAVAYGTGLCTGY